MTCPIDLRWREQRDIVMSVYFIDQLTRRLGVIKTSSPDRVSATEEAGIDQA